MVDAFRASELLYRRFRRAQIVKGEVVAASLQFPTTGSNTGQSVNRSEFSKAKDALWYDDTEERYEGWGVFQFPVSCLPSAETCPDTTRVYRFFSKHVPLDKNYAHSEVWCDTIPATNIAYVRPSAKVRKQLRTIISQELKIVHSADV